MAASLGVIIAGVVILLTKITIVDPIVSVAIAVLIAVGAWHILRETTDILQSLNAILSEKYHIGHTTIQFECHDHEASYCSVEGLYCNMELEKSNGLHAH